MQAVFRHGPHQYLVNEGDVLELPLSKNRTNLNITDVLLIVDGENVLVGQPTVSGYTVACEYVQDTKGDKVRVLKYKAKSRYRKVTGFRPKFSQYKVTSISSGKNTATKSEDASTETPAKPKTRKTRETKS